MLGNVATSFPLDLDIIGGLGHITSTCKLPTRSCFFMVWSTSSSSGEDRKHLNSRFSLLNIPHQPQLWPEEPLNEIRSSSFKRFSLQTLYVANQIYTNIYHAPCLFESLGVECSKFPFEFNTFWLPLMPICIFIPSTCTTWVILRSKHL